MPSRPSCKHFLLPSRCLDHALVAAWPPRIVSGSEAARPRDWLPNTRRQSRSCSNRRWLTAPLARVWIATFAPARALSSHAARTTSSQARPALQLRTPRLNHPECVPLSLCSWAYQKTAVLFMAQRCCLAASPRGGAQNSGVLHGAGRERRGHPDSQIRSRPEVRGVSTTLAARQRSCCVPYSPVARCSFPATPRRRLSLTRRPLRCHEHARHVHSTTRPEAAAGLWRCRRTTTTSTTASTPIRPRGGTAWPLCSCTCALPEHPTLHSAADRRTGGSVGLGL